MRYSIEPEDWIFVKGYGFLLFAENMGKNIGKNIRKNMINMQLDKLVNMAIKFLDQATDPLKTASKIQFRKQQKQLVIWLVTKLMIKLQKPQKLRHNIVLRQLQMKQECLKKEIYPQKQDRKLLTT